MTGDDGYLWLKITAKTDFSNIITILMFRAISQKAPVNALLSALILINIVYTRNSVINSDYFHFSLLPLSTQRFCGIWLKMQRHNVRFRAIISGYHRRWLGTYSPYASGERIFYEAEN
ncbi:hypothetical protein Dda3937_00077 [Dickeya dadantii 3937]|uniref:Uncharacterized protein n=1 Tax=Dickeya dadantii (strain 3937) TaxID=198628 RepID=E0SCK8_DICD3|nr:hypothetical protein Dda3937_00077 [Dickeya dadantii 3937]